MMLDQATLEHIGLPELTDDLGAIRARDRVDRIGDHLEIGRRAADRDPDGELFAASFDVRPPGARHGD